MARDPRDSTTWRNWHPVALAAGVLVMGYVVGPALGHLAHWFYVTVDDNLADFGD